MFTVQLATYHGLISSRHKFSALREQSRPHNSQCAHLPKEPSWPHYSHSATSTVDEPHNFPTETPLTITIVKIPIPSHHHCWSTSTNTVSTPTPQSFFYHYHSHSFIHPNNNNKYISQLNRLIYHPSVFQRVLTSYILYRRRRTNTNNKVQGNSILYSQ